MLRLGFWFYRALLFRLTWRVSGLKRDANVDGRGVALFERQRYLVFPNSKRVPKYFPQEALQSIVGLVPQLGVSRITVFICCLTLYSRPPSDYWSSNWQIRKLDGACAIQLEWDQRSMDRRDRPNWRPQHPDLAGPKSHTIRNFIDQKYIFVRNNETRRKHMNCILCIA